MSPFRRPVIGLASHPAQAHYGETALPAQGVADAYVGAVWAAGGQPTILPATVPPGAAAGFLDALDGVILTGGGDVDPARYGQPRHELTTGIMAERDELEIELTVLAVRRALPLLAICRGIQVLNVALGGSLIQDLVTAGHQRHESQRLPPTRHDVQVIPATVLAAIAGSPCLRVNSLHHQAVGRLGHGLRPVAVAADGTTEAVALDGPGWALGIQWHPELMYAADPVQLALFRALVERARARADSEPVS